MRDKVLISTERLDIYPLYYNDLKLIIENKEKFEEDFSCKYDAEPIEGRFKEVMQGQLDKMNENEDNSEFLTFWMIERLSDGVIVGAIDFKNIPQDGGDMEIGYGINDKYANRGYMTETVKAFTKWAFDNTKIKRVIAETEKDNIPSHRVLKHCGFKKYSDKETFWWELKR